MMNSPLSYFQLFRHLFFPDGIQAFYRGGDDLSVTDYIGDSSPGRGAKRMDVASALAPLSGELSAARLTERSFSNSPFPIPNSQFSKKEAVACLRVGGIFPGAL